MSAARCLTIEATPRKVMLFLLEASEQAGRLKNVSNHFRIEEVQNILVLYHPLRMQLSIQFCQRSSSPSVFAWSWTWLVLLLPNRWRPWRPHPRLSSDICELRTGTLRTQGTSPVFFLGFFKSHQISWNLQYMTCVQCVPIIWKSPSLSFFHTKIFTIRLCRPFLQQKTIEKWYHIMPRSPNFTPLKFWYLILIWATKNIFACPFHGSTFRPFLWT